MMNEKIISGTRYDTTICTITTNEWYVLENCIQSIRQQCNESIRIQLIIVDNCSTDFDYNSLTEPSDPHLRIDIIHNTKKLNFSENNNLAIQKAKSDLILILNPDTIIQDGTLIYMFDYLRKNNDVGAATCKLLNEDESFQVSSRRFIKLKYVLANRLDTLKLFNFTKLLDEYLMSKEFDTQPKEVDYILGACMFIRKRVLDEVGIFDPRFLLYAEDTDLCYRIKEAGWKVMYVPNVSIIHIYARKAAKNIFSKSSILQVYTMILFYLKHYWKLIQ